MLMPGDSSCVCVTSALEFEALPPENTFKGVMPTCSFDFSFVSSSVGRESFGIGRFSPINVEFLTWDSPPRYSIIGFSLSVAFP